MTDKKFAIQAKAECNSAETTAHHGGSAGRPFWNAESSQFMYVPAFQFQPIPGCWKYRYMAEDEKGETHTFESDNAHALLAPIWKDIPEGVVKLTVYALDEEGNEAHTVGVRTFFKLSPFPADLPPAARSYREAAIMAYKYAMSQQFMIHWLEGTPDPNYGLNVYPSKMISAIIEAMLRYSRLCPEDADRAMRIAENSADYLLGITPKEGPSAGIPPTYEFDFRHSTKTAAVAFDEGFIKERENWLMCIYPPNVGSAYLSLEEATGDAKYLDAAIAIGEYYRDHIEENGSWYLIRDIRTGEVLAPDYCNPLQSIVPFLMKLCKRTGNSIWKELSDRAVAYIEKSSLAAYDWGAQFEDSLCSVNYSNLAHNSATVLINYYCDHCADDEKRMAAADDLTRFLEDQFIVWKRPAPWNISHYDTSMWHTPCALEQYAWYVPIDGCTAGIAHSFLAMYKAGRGELHREKARALMDSLTRTQREDGLIPTHWMTKENMNGADFWINCLFASARMLAEFADFFEKE